MSRWSALDTQVSLPEATAEKIVSAEADSVFSSFYMGIFILLVVAITVVIAITGSRKKQANQEASLALNVIEPQFASETLMKIPQEEQPQARVYAKKSSSIFFDAEDTIPEPFVHTEKGHTFQEYAETLDSGRQTFQSERPDGIGANLDYLKEDLKKKGLGLSDFVESFGVSVPDAFVDSWTKESTKTSERNHNILKNSSGASEGEMRQLAQEAMQSVPLNGNSEAVASVLREILAARTEAVRIGLDLGPMDPAQKSAFESYASGKTKASSIAQTILSRI